MIDKWIVNTMKRRSIPSRSLAYEIAVINSGLFWAIDIKATEPRTHIHSLEPTEPRLKWKFSYTLWNCWSFQHPCSQSKYSSTWHDPPPQPNYNKFLFFRQVEMINSPMIFCSVLERMLMKAKADGTQMGKGRVFWTHTHMIFHKILKTDRTPMSAPTLIISTERTLEQSRAWA